MTFTAGLVLSALCGDVNAAMQVAIAAFYPVLILSGEFALCTGSYRCALTLHNMYRCTVAS